MSLSSVKRVDFTPENRANSKAAAASFTTHEANHQDLHRHRQKLGTASSSQRFYFPTLASLNLT